MKRTGLLALVVAGGAAFPGCGGSGDYTIDEVRVLSRPRGVIGRDVTDAERFPSRSGLAWDLPDGWHEVPSDQQRIVTFGMDRSPDVECYVSMLPGAAGGVAANVNRWRRQMGQEAIPEVEVAGLPKQSLIGLPGVIVDLEGTYTDMQGQAHPGHRMAGVLAEFPAFMLFVKLTGPSAQVESELPGMLALCSSLRPDRPMERRMEPPPGAPVTSGDGYKWSIPDGWVSKATPPNQFTRRLVTLVPADSPRVETYVTLMGGDGGGMVSNLTRWSSQVGGPELSEQDVASLPRVSVLGQSWPLFEGSGALSDMSGPERGDFALLGVACLLGDVSMFIKMTGPRDEVARQRGRFLEFCRSIQEDS